MGRGNSSIMLAAGDLFDLFGDGDLLPAACAFGGGGLLDEARDDNFGFAGLTVKLGV